MAKRDIHRIPVDLWTFLLFVVGTGLFAISLYVLGLFILVFVAVLIEEVGRSPRFLVGDRLALLAGYETTAFGLVLWYRSQQLPIEWGWFTGIALAGPVIVALTGIEVAFRRRRRRVRLQGKDYRTASPGTRRECPARVPSVNLRCSPWPPGHRASRSPTTPSIAVR